MKKRSGIRDAVFCEAMLNNEKDFPLNEGDLPDCDFLGSSLQEGDMLYIPRIRFILSTQSLNAMFLQVSLDV